MPTTKEMLAYSIEVNSLCMSVRQLIVSDATVYAIWNVANRERWDLNRFLQECVVALAREKAEFIDNEVTRLMKTAPLAPPTAAGKEN